MVKIERQTLLDWCEEKLETSKFKDYAPNGLQVEGSEQVSKIITAVTASRAAIEYAVQQQADMLLVHHGMFWKSEPITITGWKKQRIEKLLQHNINMVAYHLPLDAHPELGNNAMLAQKMRWIHDKSFGEQNLLNIGKLPENQQNLTQLSNVIEQTLGRKPIVIGDEAQTRRKIAWCTGGAQGYFQQAIDAGADVYISGEISESQYHLANETGVAYISAGHHATERYGIQALGESIKQTFGIECYFFDERNPA